MLDKYTKKNKKEEEDALKFLGLKNKKEEDNIKNNIEKCYENIITNYIRERISNCSLEEKNKEKLISFIKTIIKNLNPSFKDLKDSMDINDYIKVKIVQNNDFSNSKVIDGFAMTKNVCSKKMSEKQESPKILLLDLDLNVHKSNEPLEIKKKESTEFFNTYEIKKKLKSLKIDVILINKGISHKFLEFLLKDTKLIIIINVKTSSLQKIARCTKGEVITSLTDLRLERNNSEENNSKLSSNIYGTCKSFQIINVSKFQKKKKKNKINIIDDLSSFNNSNFENIILSNKNKLMIFDGCDSILFQTLLLSGPDTKPLQEIKNLLKKEIFSTAREYFLQKKVLYFLFCSIPPFISDDSKDNNSQKNPVINKDKPKNTDIQKNKSLFLSRQITNIQKQKNNLLENTGINRKNTSKHMSIINNQILSNIKSHGTQETININSLKKKPSKSPESEQKSKNQNNNISLISNKFNSNINLTTFNNIQKKLLVINKHNSNNSKSKSSKRNFSHFFNKKRNSDSYYKEKISNHSYSINKDKTKLVFNKSNYQELLTNKKYEEKDINLENPLKKQNYKVNPNLQFKKYLSDNRQNTTTKQNKKTPSKFFSNNLLLKVDEENEEKKINFQEKGKLDTSHSNYESNPNECIPSPSTTCIGDYYGEDEKINNSYKYGFDISPIVTNETCLQLIRLKMCKGESKLINNSTNPNSEEFIKNPKKKRNSVSDVSLTENALLKSLNFICGDIQKLNIVYYNSKDKEENKDKNNERENDKPLGKLIIDMIAEKDNKCNKCKNIMSNHFYYLYNSDFSRIKIEFITNSDCSLDIVNEYINNKDKENNKKNNPDNNQNQNQEIDYNIDLYSYGFCKECKQIVTPLIKLPKDLFNYSSSKFFKHFFGNDTIHNRNDEEDFNLTGKIEKRKCSHYSFKDINRIFLAKNVAIKFQYEKLKKYKLISVQNIPDIQNLKLFTSKEINSDECIKITNKIKENFKMEKKEFEKIADIIKINNLSLTISSSYFQRTGEQINIIDLCIEQLKKVIDYLNEDKDDILANSSKKNNNDINSLSCNKINERETSSSKETENKDLKERNLQLKNKNINYDNSPLSGEESTKKESSKAPSLYEKEKNNFPKIIKNLYSKKFENYSKKIGLNKRIYFRISQINVLYNKIRTILNRLKIFISLELILKEEDLKNKPVIMENKPEKSDNDKISFNADIHGKDNKNIINENDIKDISKGESKSEQENIIYDSTSIKSKKQKQSMRPADKIISNNNTENNKKEALANNDVESNSSLKFDNNSNIDNSIFKFSNSNNNINSDSFINSNKNLIFIENIKNNDCKENNVHPKLELEKLFIKSKSDNILNSAKEKEKLIKVENNANENINVEKDNLNKNQNPENEEKTNFSPETLIKLLIDKFVTVFDYKDKEIYENINKIEEYSHMLKIINFYDEQPNDFSSIIKESDLSSIVAYAISSSQYKNFIKEKTNLLDIKRILPITLDLSKNLGRESNENKNDNNKSNSKSNILVQTKVQAQVREEQTLFDTLLLFDSSNINYVNMNSKKKINNAAENKNINHLLETEILCKDSNHFVININTLNDKKFKCNGNPSRKMTISRQTMSNQMTSPGYLFSPKPSETEKNYYKIENDLEFIEEKISGFFEEIKYINEGVKNLNKSNKLESVLKLLNLSNNINLLNNINVEESLSQNNNNNNNSNTSKNLQQKKKELLNEFVNSYNNYSKKVSDENWNKFIDKNRKEQNIIDIIGKIYFPEDLFKQSEIEVVIYYPRQFEALRIAYCCAYDDLLVSITKSNVWADVSGGKSKASFYKTSDEKYLFKSISQYEFNMFLKIAYAYFNHIDKYLFHNMPSLLMKILGVYKIKIKKGEENKVFYLMMMENLNYGFNFKKEKILSYDLKGSTINRYIKNKEKKAKENVVLLDSNFKEDFNSEPIPLENDLFGLLLMSVYNDTLFLSKLGIIDYSLLLYINENNYKHNIIRVGIIDFIRKYTWDKQIEHILKTIINGFNSPTIINPVDYKERFITAIKSYFIGI